MIDAISPWIMIAGGAIQLALWPFAKPGTITRLQLTGLIVLSLGLISSGIVHLKHVETSPASLAVGLVLVFGAVLVLIGVFYKRKSASV